MEEVGWKAGEERREEGSAAGGVRRKAGGGRKEGLRMKMKEKVWSLFGTYLILKSINYYKQRNTSFSFFFFFQIFYKFLTNYYQFLIR